MRVQDFSHIKASPSPNWSLKDKEDVVDWPLRPLDTEGIRGAIEGICSQR
jgi:hypothetical protein